MNLRSRILLGYVFLITVLVLTAAGAALSFHQLGRGIERVMAENFESVRAATDMLEALERQDSACLSLLLGKQKAAEDLDREEKRFFRSLELAQSNITIDEEGDVLSDIERLFSSYKSTREALLASRPSTPLAAYDLETLPRFEAVKAAVIRLLDINHRAMRDADMSNRRFAMSGSIVLGIVVALTLLSFGFISRLLNRDLLVRMGSMSNAVKDIAGGNLGRRFDPVQDDELGLLARQLNAALDAQAEAEGRTKGMLAHQRQLLLAMLDRWGGRAALVGMDGIVIAATLDEKRRGILDEHKGIICERGRVALKETSSNLQDASFIITTEDGEALSFSALVVNRSRPVGWVAVFSGSSRNQTQ